MTGLHANLDTPLDTPKEETVRQRPIAEFEQLTCPACDYNLTGLSGSRCPECGGSISIEFMRRLSGNEVSDAVPWDREGGFLGFWKTWILAAFSPKKLAEEFPGRHSSVRAGNYSLICFAGAAAALIPLGYIEPGRSRIADAVAVAIGLVVALNMSGTLLAGWMTKLSPPSYSPAPYHFWRGLVHYSSGFALFLGLGGWLAVLGAVHLDAKEELTGTALFLAAAGIALLAIVWWYVSLMKMFRKRCRMPSARFMACLQPPVAIVLGALCGAGVSVFLIVPLRALMDCLQFLAT